MNGLCTLDLVKESTSKSKDVLVTILFKLKDAYRDFSIYIDGLSACLSKKEEYFPEFRVICLIDYTIEGDNLERLMQYDIEIRKYHCKLMVNKYELIGFLVRYIYIFDYEWNDTNAVIMFDCDAPELFFGNRKQYDLIKMSNKYFHYMTGCTSDLESAWKRSDNIPPLLGEKIISNYKLPHKLLTTFIRCLYDKTCPDQDKIDSIFLNTRYNTYPYGIDEYFMNHHVIEYILKHDLPLSYYTHYFIPSFLKCSYKYAHDENKPLIETKLINKLLGYVTTVDSTKTIKSKLSFLYNLFFNKDGALVRSFTPKIVKLIKAFYHIIQKWYNDKYYTIYQRDTLKRILEYKNYVLKEKLNIIKQRKISNIIVDSIQIH